MASKAANPAATPSLKEYAAALEAHAALSAELAKLEAVCAAGFAAHGALTAFDATGKAFRFSGRTQSISRSPRPDLLARAICKINLAQAWSAASETNAPTSTEALREVCVFTLALKLSDRLPGAVKALPWALQAAIREFMDSQDASGNGGEYERYGSAAVKVLTTEPGDKSISLAPGDKPMVSEAFAPLAGSED